MVRMAGSAGCTREIVYPERFVHTESWEDWNPGEVPVTAVLTERDGQTTLTGTSLYPSQEVRDQLLKAGMAAGAGETFDRLAEVLASKLEAGK